MDSYIKMDNLEDIFTTHFRTKSFESFKPVVSWGWNLEQKQIPIFMYC